MDINSALFRRRKY